MSLKVGTVLRCTVPTMGRLTSTEEGKEGSSEEIDVGDVVVLCDKKVVDYKDVPNRVMGQEVPFPVLSCFFVMKKNGTVLRLGWLFKVAPDEKTNDDQLLNRFSIV